MPNLNLFIWRHAEAEDGSPDLARALTPKGRRDAARVGRALSRLLDDSSRIIASPAVRTRETADGLTDIANRAIETDPRIAPGASLSAVLTTVDEAVSTAVAAGGAASIVVVGHQPWVGQLARHLLTGDDDDWAFRKAAAWWLVRRGRDGGVQWTLKSVIDPDVV